MIDAVLHFVKVKKKKHLFLITMSINVLMLHLSVCMTFIVDAAGNLPLPALIIMDGFYTTERPPVAL